MIKNITVVILLSLFTTIQAQENEEYASNDLRHSIKLGIGHAYISQGKIDGDRKWLATPAIALNYSYLIDERWSIGLHNDLILESFIVEDPESSEDIIEREYPIATILMSGYRLTESFGVGLGAGMEWEKNRNYSLVRLAAEYGLEIDNKGLEVIIGIDYDILINAYDSINFGIGINKFFK